MGSMDGFTTIPRTKKLRRERVRGSCLATRVQRRGLHAPNEFLFVFTSENDPRRCDCDVRGETDVGS